jgi:Uma2 family endonuclease
MAVAQEHFDRGSSVRIPMSYEEWLTHGETKHHEWSEGVLYVNPPSRWHVLVAKHLARDLDDACPAGLTVYPDWGLRTPLGDFEPDLMVAPEDLPDESYTSVPPLLVVEIASPTTRDLDWDRKLRAYEQAGVEWYWILDRQALTVFANRGGTFVETQRIAAGDGGDTVGPITLRIDPGSYPPAP